MLKDEDGIKVAGTVFRRTVQAKRYCSYFWVVPKSKLVPPFNSTAQLMIPSE
jgi:hypothetical protein